MIPVYNAHSFEKILDGGTTRPWLVNVDDNISIVPFVVKLYERPKPNYNPKLNEVICSALAPLFDLNVPSFCFVKLNDDFIQLLKPEQTGQLKNKDYRMNYSTEFIKGNLPFDKLLSRKYLSHYDIQTIFAFDCLIHNVDRTDRKPNILFKGRKSYLIDHEKTFCINENYISQLIDGVLKYHYKAHIFYDYLRNSKANKGEFFEDFLYHLERVNFDSLDAYVSILTGLGMDTEHYEIIKEYLCTVYRDKNKFISILRGFIS